MEEETGLMKISQDWFKDPEDYWALISEIYSLAQDVIFSLYHFGLGNNVTEPGKCAVRYYHQHPDNWEHNGRCFEKHGNANTKHPRLFPSVVINCDNVFVGLPRVEPEEDDDD
jgi:hypothetical protein